MAYSIFPGVWELVILLAMGSGAGVPLGIPPGPEDPVMSRVAPEQCVFYLSWSGMAQPDPASPNHTEQLLAEKEVQECLAQLETLVIAAVRQGTKNDPQAAALVDPVATVVKTVLTHPAAVYVAKLDPAAGPGGLRAGAIVNLGDKTADVQQALVKIEQAMTQGRAAAPSDTATWRRLPLDMDGLVAEWAIKGKYLILGMGEGEADQIVERGKKEPPAWLAQLRQQLVVPRPSSVAYVNVAGVFAAAGSPMHRDVREMLDVLGLANIASVAHVTGLDDTGCISKTQIKVEGDLKGILSVFAAEPLTKDDLAVIPKDASLAAAVRLDLAKGYKEVLDMVGRAEPRGRDELLGAVGQFEEQMKINISRDVFASVGDAWRVYNSPTEGGLILTGMTAVVNLRDRDRLVAANGKLVMSALLGGTAGQMTGEGRGRSAIAIGQSKFAGQTIFHVKSFGEAMPFAPAWCITEKELVVALFPQNVKSYLSRAAGADSLADVPDVAARFAGDESPMAVAYVDTPELFKIAYPIARLVVQMAMSGFGREGLPADITLLPSAPTIGRHLQPTVVGVRRTDAGIVIESRRTLPVGCGGPLAVVWLMPLGAPGGLDLGHLPTQQNVSMNNLKQIALALHNHHDARKTFPAAAGSQKPGQPPVSWRVLVLPFLEEMELYEEYNFDEPWDSENNLKVAARMPEVFKAPGSKAAAQGKTNYLAVTGDEYVFGPTKGRGLYDIRDGSSYTIMVVEVADERAVPWTKPDDFTPDKTNPIAGLVGLRPGGFLAAMADGSVRRFSAEIDAATLKALFTHAGREPPTISDLFEQ
ncbi:MAG: DUF1559 domain-containing protein [Pirellulales bacterium]|nr:DUF1559 domain-containing protein [Pirellulales bacterium]